MKKVIIVPVTIVAILTFMNIMLGLIANYFCYTCGYIFQFVNLPAILIFDTAQSGGTEALLKWPFWSFVLLSGIAAATVIICIGLTKLWRVTLKKSQRPSD